MTSTITIGIDNGLDGAIVVLENGQMLYKRIMPTRVSRTNKKRSYDIKELSDFFGALMLKYDDCNINAILERTQVTPVAGKMSCYSMGFCFGMMQALLTAYRIPFEIVRAIDWQRIVLKGNEGLTTKEASIRWAVQRFPNESWKKGGKRAVKYHDGLTDACAMAYYGFIMQNSVYNV